MIELTVSRVCMGICGLILLASVISPVTGMYESGTVTMESDIPRNIADLVDDFHRSRMDVLTIQVSDILPNSASFVEFGGHVVTVTTERGTYKGWTAVPLTSDGEVFRYEDTLRLSRSDGCVKIEMLI